MRISFGETKFDVIICLNGELPSKEYFDSREGAPIVAADGAALKLKRKGIEIFKIVGDLDTLERKGALGEFDPEKVLRIPEQDSNDFEKALKFAIESGFKNILVAGFDGGEIEHTLNNWSVFIKYSKKANLCLTDGLRYGFPISGKVSVEIKKGETASLIPQTRAVVSSKGLKWELNETLLELGRKEGARNVAARNDPEIEVLEGEILFFCDARPPYAPRYSD